MLISKKFKYWSTTSLIKTLFFNCKYGYLKNKQFIIYPKTKIFIHPSSYIDLGKGHLVLNFSHIGKRFRSQYCILWMDKGSRLELHNNNFKLCEGSSIYIRENATLKLEGRGFINNGSEINCYSHIEIGEGTIIAQNVTICDSDSHTVYENGIEREKTKPIKIGRNVWICRNTIILKGVEIGDNCIIAAGSIVTTNIPANSMAAGIPAKVLKQNINWIF